MIDLLSPTYPREERIGEGILLLRGFAETRVLLPALNAVVTAAPFRHFVTPGGQRMSVAMTNCGALGWISDRRGYRYDPVDADNGAPWPPMPAVFAMLAREAADRAGFPGFSPDSCLINRYGAGDRLSAHQDRNERDFAQPIVSVSLGLPATFLLYGDRRAGPARPILLEDGDVLVWGGPARLFYHGVRPLAAGYHPSLECYRINLTFRRAG
jgi:DNA oxidative demethylase